MSSWLWSNKEWLFQGIGATAIIAVLGFCWRALRQKNRPELTPAELMPPVATELPSVSQAWFLVEKVPGLRALARRRIYTDAEINRRVRVCIRSEGDGIACWKNGNEGRVSVWLDLVNLNPFPLKLEGIAGQFTVNGSGVAEIKVIDRDKIPAVAWHQLHFDAVLSAAQIQQIEFQLKHQPEAPAGITARIYLQTEVGEVTLWRTPATGNRRFHNFPAAAVA